MSAPDETSWPDQGDWDELNREISGWDVPRDGKLPED